MKRSQWIRRLTDPDEDLSLEEFMAVPAALLLTQKPIKRMVSELELAVKEGESITMLEAAVLMLAHIRENVKDAREGTQHLEGMLGSFDEMMATSNPLYEQIAGKRAKPVAIGGPEHDGRD